MADTAQLILGSLTLTIVVASFLIWSLVIARLQEGRPLVATEPRRGVPWKATDLYVVLVIYVGAQFAAARLVIHFLGHAPGEALAPETLAPILLSNALANVAVVLVTVGYLLLRGTTFADLGFLPFNLATDLRLGAITFVAAVVPVLGIQLLLTKFFKSEHPVQMLLTKDSSPSVLLLCFLTAVIVAPLAEEFLFRVVLQGWMEAVTMSYRREREGTLVSGDSSGSIPDTIASPPPLMVWPLVLSSLAFALVHYGHGPDPIPLFFFALMLGYVYQKTHRIWPSLFVHACLNAWSLTLIWLTLRFGLQP